MNLKEQKKVSKIVLSSCLGFDKVAELIIQNGADVTVVGNGTNTPLIWATQKSKYELCL